MRFKTLQFLKRKKKIRVKMERQERWVRYIVIFLFCCLFLALSNCDNVRQSIGISTKPFGKNDSFENSTKLNYKIIFGTVRGKKTEEDDD